MSVSFVGLRVIVAEGPFDVLPMIVESLVEVVSEGFFSLVDQSFADGFDFFDHDKVEALGLFEVVDSQENLLERLLAQGFVKLFDDKAYDIRDGVNLLLGEEVLDLLFIHVEEGSRKDLMIKFYNE